MTLNAGEAVQNMIAYTMVEDKNSIINILKRNGVKVPSEATDNQIIKATLLASSKSPNFKSDLSKVLMKNSKKIGELYKGFVGDSTDFGFTGIDDFNLIGLTSTSVKNETVALPAVKNPAQSVKKTERVAKRITETNPQGKSTFGLFFQNLAKSLTSEETINAGLNIGLTAINNKVAGKQNALQSEAAIITQKQDEVRQTLAQTPQKNKTLTYVFVGVGALALIGIIYYVVKKKTT